MNQYGRTARTQPGGFTIMSIMVIAAARAAKHEKCSPVILFSPLF